MQLFKFIVCISVLVTKACSAGSIIKPSKLDESSLIETLIDILESCYADRFSTVGLVGPSLGSITTKMSLRDTPIPVTIIDKTSRINSAAMWFGGPRHKLQVFVITTSIQTSLYAALAEGWQSKWWNYMASFLIIDLTDSENGCLTASGKLLEAWYFNLLNPKFVCFHKTRGHLIYTFNPYTNKAPSPWHQEGTYQGINGHPWTLFVREYREDESNCEGLDFDKTVDLGGHEIRGVGEDMYWWWSEDSSFTPNLPNRRRNVTVHLLMSSLNATWKVVSRPFIEENDITGEVNAGYHDIFLTAVVQGPGWPTVTDVVTESEIMFVTQFPGHKSQLDKLISVLDRSSRFGVLVVFMITLLFLKFWLHQPLIPSIMDLVLLVSNAGLHRIPQQTAPRIYIAGLFIFVVTIQGIYSGVFASLLTKDVRLKTMDTQQDLARHNYSIYGEYAPWFFTDKAFEGRLCQSSQYLSCLNDVLRDPKAACVTEDLVIFQNAKDYNLHMSKESVGHVYGVFLVRADWPLTERVNKIFQRVKAGGLQDSRYRLETESILRSVKSYEDQEDEAEVKVLTLENLRFAFVMLGIGLACATVTFIIEVATFGTAIANLRNRIRR